MDKIVPPDDGHIVARNV